MATNCTLIISDLHAPYHHPNALEFLNALKKSYKPTKVICIGDELDAHGWSRHTREPDAMGQADEVAAARKVMGSLYRMFPAVDVCTSNHGDRAVKAMARAGMPTDFLRSPGVILGAPVGWKWARGYLYDGVAYEHGTGYRGINAAITAAKTNRMNTVIGHVHASAGVQYHANQFSNIWGMNVGCLVDASSVAFRYAIDYPNKQVLGSGVVWEGVPIFVPMGV